MKPIIIGSRGSPLALAQTRLVVADLKKAWPARNFEIHIIKTEGDKLSEQPQKAGETLGKGLFTSELEGALLSGKIDLAVHSLKDLPTNDSPGVTIAAIPKRADAHDVLITRGADLDRELGPRAVIATGSPRRAAQLKAVREDLTTAEIRGNIDTRLRKFRENSAWSGILLAAAGLERLKPDTQGLFMTSLPFEQMLPAPGQGALGLQIRTDDTDDVRKLIGMLNDPGTAAAVKAERMFLQALGGGCREPIAAYAEAGTDGSLVMQGFVWWPSEDAPRRSQLKRRLDQAETLGVDLAVEISR